jgi:hypothetical protein
MGLEDKISKESGRTTEVNLVELQIQKMLSGVSFPLAGSCSGVVKVELVVEVRGTEYKIRDFLLFGCSCLCNHEPEAIKIEKDSLITHKQTVDRQLITNTT